jgi:hypothetical protein
LEEARRVAKEAHDKYGVETVGLAADGTDKGAMEKLVANVFTLLSMAQLIAGPFFVRPY